VKLNSKEKKIIYLYYEKKIETKNITLFLNLTQDRITQIKISAINKIKKYIKENNICSNNYI